jgi:cell division protein FtsW
LPEVTTDSIFAVIGEELGFIGATILILVFGLLIYRLFRIAERAPDQFGKILAVGISSTLAIQIFLNLAAMVSLVPLTGVPLPLISYGGTSLVVTLFCIGILLNISKRSNTQAS